MTVNLIALGEILGQKGSTQVATGDVDENGTPIFRTESAPIRPGEAFTTDPATAAMLICRRAAAPAGSEEAEAAIARARESRG